MSAGVIGRRPAAPEPLVRDKAARIAPAEQDADEIGEPVPADRERADLDRDRIDRREGNVRAWSGLRLESWRMGRTIAAGA